MNRQSTRLSVVVPAYNEEHNVVPLYTSLHKVLTGLDTYEIIFVNDGSYDKTAQVLDQLADQDKNVRVINFSRNFGKEMATTAGILQAQGEAIMMIDADGQFPPDLIPQFVEKWQAGAQVVTGLRLTNQKEGFIKRYCSKVFYRLMSRLAHTKITPRATDFRLIDRQVQTQFKHFTEHNRITRGLIDWAGFREEFIPFHAKARTHGDAGYSIPKLTKLAMNSFVSLSLAPLYFSGYAGLIITPVAFILGAFVIIEQLVLNDPWHLKFTGTAMLGIALLFFVGILLISQGLVALYISHIHAETQNRPLYIIDEKSSRNLGASLDHSEA